MNNSKAAKRQTRAMVVTAALILGIAVVIIAMSVSQNRRGEDGKAPGHSTVPASDTAHTETGAPTDKPTLFDDTTAMPETKKPAESTAPVVEDVTPTAVPDPLPDFIAPVSGMLMKAHSVEIPVYSLTMEDYRTHTGVDIAASAGTAVRAAAAGTVEEIWEDPMMGQCLRIAHGGKAESVYKNLAPELAENITVGTAVTAGTVIGAVGESALAEIAEESHLHYELCIDGAAMNPADFMLIGGTDTSFEG